MQVHESISLSSFKIVASTCVKYAWVSDMAQQMEGLAM